MSAPCKKAVRQSALQRTITYFLVQKQTSFFVFCFLFFKDILGRIRVWKLPCFLLASLCSPDRLWQRELQVNRLDNKSLWQPYKLRMTYDEVLWSERQDRKYQDLICVRLAMIVMNSCGWVGLSAKVLKIHAAKILHVDSKYAVQSFIVEPHLKCIPVVLLMWIISSIMCPCQFGG